MAHKFTPKRRVTRYQKQGWQMKLTLSCGHEMLRKASNSSTRPQFAFCRECG